MNANLYRVLSRIATWDGANGPCFCNASDYGAGRTEKHNHTEDCDEARRAMAYWTNQTHDFIVRGIAWDYTKG